MKTPRIVLLILAFGLAALFTTAAERPSAPSQPVQSAARQADLDRAIASHRRGTLVIQTEPGAEVRVEQLRHEFWFGAALSSSIFTRNANSRDAEKYREIFLANFNCAVTENALKWHAMERRRGQVNHADVEAILRWTDQHDIPLRGHNIFWGTPSKVQDWVKSLGTDELRETIKARALDIGRRYRGRFAEYDLNNEMIHGNYYEQRLGPEITLQMARWVRQGDPDAVLFLNDYDILTGRRLADYVAHIRTLLSQGVPLGGIGVQGHSHGDTFDPDALRRALDQLAQFKLPIRVTEFNMPGQNSKSHKNPHLPLTQAQEEAKARALADFYRICFAHPAVTGILMWGFWEGANWIPASSLYRRDWSATPAARTYRDLVFNQWWTRWKGVADATGRCEVRAFYGRHRVKAGKRETIVELKPAEKTRTVSLR